MHQLRKLAVIGIVHPLFADSSVLRTFAKKQNIFCLSSEDLALKALATPEARFGFIKSWLFKSSWKDPKKKSEQSEQPKEQEQNYCGILDGVVEASQAEDLIQWLKRGGFRIQVILLEPTSKRRALNGASRIQDFDANTLPLKDVISRHNIATLVLDRPCDTETIHKIFDVFIKTEKITAFPAERKPVRGKSPLPIPSAMAFA